MQWLKVDQAGLAKLLARRGKPFVIHELVQNAWDQTVTRVDVRLTKEPGARIAVLVVEDDDPDGFANLSHAFTLFAESSKKDDPLKRGRFNLGEKMVLALCETAEIITTTGGLVFLATGRHRLRKRRERGSRFTCRIKMTNAEYAECCATVRNLIPPTGVVTTFTSSEGTYILPHRTMVAQVEAVLLTEIADAEGLLRRVKRKTSIAVYETQPDEVGMLYEMGIPVVQTGDKYHVDIGQKVPLNFDRDNVPPAYLRDVRTNVLNAVHARITDHEMANAGWVREAMADPHIAPAAVASVVQRRFGKAVAYDPSDPEANKRAVAAGYVVVHGSQLSRQEWANVRRAGVLPAAGKVTPSPKPYSTDPDASQVVVIIWDQMRQAEQQMVMAARRIAQVLLGFEPEIRIVATRNKFTAAYGDRCLDFNRSRLGKQWFEASATTGRLTEAAIDLLIHELGHEYSSDHLSTEYYGALTRLGAKLVLAVADQGVELLRV